MPQSLLPTKNELRALMRSRLAAMSDDEIALKSARIIENLKGGSHLPEGMTVGLFGGIKGEPDLLALIPWLMERQCSPVFFGFHNDQLVPQRVGAAYQLTRGVFGVWMPAPEAVIVPHRDLDIILTPGLAFGQDGSRLGRGRGFYDKLFAHPEVKARRIGIGWQSQVVESVPLEAHDALMHVVITETSVD